MAQQLSPLAPVAGNFPCNPKAEAEKAWSAQVQGAVGWPAVKSSTDVLPSPGRAPAAQIANDNAT
jgi:hypothetical protein